MDKKEDKMSLLQLLVNPNQGKPCQDAQVQVIRVEDSFYKRD
jgi:hypothetical protein